MELVKNIFFNTDKLIENTPVKISYTGQLFQDSTNNVYIHYGFGSDWDNICDKKMEKTELGFQSEIVLPDSNILNFCFNDGNDNWDNNHGKNYVFNIEKSPIIDTNEQELSLMILNTTSLGMPHKLRKSYILSKKIRISLYKIFRYIPKIISGNYRRRIIN